MDGAMLDYGGVWGLHSFLVRRVHHAGCVRACSAKPVVSLHVNGERKCFRSFRYALPLEEDQSRPSLPFRQRCSSSLSAGKWGEFWLCLNLY